MEKKDKIDWKKELLDLVKIIIIAAAAAFLISNFIIINSSIPTGSMEHTMMTGSRVIGFRLFYYFKKPERGDVAVFKYPDDEQVKYVKRIIGLPGESVEVIDGKVYINDSSIPLAESYLPEPMKGSFGPYKVPEDSYFMMGDNRNNSLDARFWSNTFVKKDKLLAKVLFQYYPKFKSI